MDSAGYIIVHPDFITVAGSESPLVENVHITVKVSIAFKCCLKSTGSLYDFVIFIFSDVSLINMLAGIQSM